ncbi:hypothetical protein LWI28_008582 [Acer negundo]|uniref:Cytochrome f n=1 Tax=Acer negundo TaxID=4023 RepID=A0AAD5NFE1_ACENE|nr:hypothetical protein LWI28_008582 [Acer negundo]
MASSTQRIEADFSPPVAEVLAILCELQFAKGSGLEPLIIESNALEVIKLINSFVQVPTDIVSNLFLVYLRGIRCAIWSHFTSNGRRIPVPHSRVYRGRGLKAGGSKSTFGDKGDECPGLRRGMGQVYPYGNRGRGQIYPDGTESNNTVYNATAAGIVSKIIRKEKWGYEITITDALDGRQVVDIIPPGPELRVSEGESIKLDQPLTSNHNVGGFGQGDAEIVLQDPLRVQGLLFFLASVVLVQIFLVLKKKQFEKVQLSEINF